VAKENATNLGENIGDKERALILQTRVKEKENS